MKVALITAKVLSFLSLKLTKDPKGAMQAQLKFLDFLVNLIKRQS